MTTGTLAPSTRPAASPPVTPVSVRKHHRCRFHRRRDQYVGVAGDLGFHAVEPRGFARERDVRRQRTLDDRTRERALRGHRTQRRGFARRRECRRDRALRREQRDVRRHDAERVREVERVLQDVLLRGEVRRDIEARVRDQQETGLARQVEERCVRQPSLAPQSRLGCGDRSEQILVGEAAPDQRADLAFAREHHRALRSRHAARRACRRPSAARCRVRPGSPRRECARPVRRASGRGSRRTRRKARAAANPGRPGTPRQLAAPAAAGPARRASADAVGPSSRKRVKPHGRLSMPPDGRRRRGNEAGIPATPFPSTGPRARSM